MRSNEIFVHVVYVTSYEPPPAPTPAALPRGGAISTFLDRMRGKEETGADA